MVLVHGHLVLLLWACWGNVMDDIYGRGGLETESTRGQGPRVKDTPPVT